MIRLLTYLPNLWFFSSFLFGKQIDACGFPASISGDVNKVRIPKINEVNYGQKCAWNHNKKNRGG